MRDCII